MESMMSSMKFPSRGLWLDLLPFDVCERLAAHVSGGQYCKAALRLSESSLEQFGAVLSALKYKFDLGQLLGGDYLLHRWINLFAPAVRTVQFTRSYEGYTLACDMKRLRELTLLLSAESLREFSVYGSGGDIARVAKMHCLEKLTVYFGSKHIFPALFQKALPSLKSLKCLELKCSPYDNLEEDSMMEWTVDQCPFQDTRYFSGTRNGVAKACPNLTSLCLSCICGYCLRCEDDHPVWRILPDMPNVREVELSGRLPSDAVEKLRKMDAVKISKYLHNPYEAAISVGTPVTVLDCSSLSLTLEQVTALKVCSDLRELTMSVKEGAEGKLQFIVGVLPLLRKLQIKWDSPETCRHLDEGYMRRHACYCEAKPGFLLEAIRSSRSLHTVELRNVKVPLAEIKGAMEFLGERLKSWSIPFKDQDELPNIRLHELFRTAWRHNAFMSSIRATDDVRSGRDGTRKERMQQRKVLVADLRTLKGRAPYFCTDILDDIIDRCTIACWELPRREEALIDGLRGSNELAADRED